jgi:hypothetical protein
MTEIQPRKAQIKQAKPARTANLVGEGFLLILTVNAFYFVDHLTK